MCKVVNNSPKWQNIAKSGHTLPHYQNGIKVRIGICADLGNLMRQNIVAKPSLDIMFRSNIFVDLRTIGYSNFCLEIS